MTDKSLFAPPTRDEIAKAKAASDGDLFAPPTKEELALSVRPKTSIGESALAGAAQGATLGFADEMTAGMGATLDWAKGKLGQRGPIEWSDAYKTYIKPVRALDEAARADNPKAYFGGMLAGGAATSFVPGVAMTKGASALSNVAKSAAIGGVTGAGTSENNPFESYDKMKAFGGDVARGAAVGAAVQGGVEVLGRGLSALRPENLRAKANQKALQAAGFLGSDMKKMSPEEIQRVGRVLNDNGLVKPFQSLESVLGKVETAKEAAGKQIGEALGKVDDLVTQAKGMVDSGAFGNLSDAAKNSAKAQIDKQFQFNMQRIGESIEENIIKPNMAQRVDGTMAFKPELATELGKLQSLADNFKNFSPTNLVSGSQTKAALGKQINFNSETIPQVFKKEVYDVVKNELENIVGRTGNLENAVSAAGGKALGEGSAEAINQGASALYGAAKNKYGALARVEDVGSKRIGTQAGNRTISLTDYIAGGAGLAAGGPTGGIVLGTLNKAIRKYGDSTAAYGLTKVADVLEATPGALGKYYNVLADAANKGAPALVATHRALMGDPNYKAILDNFERMQAVQRRIGDKKKQQNGVQRTGE